MSRTIMSAGAPGCCRGELGLERGTAFSFDGRHCGAERRRQNAGRGGRIVLPLGHAEQAKARHGDSASVVASQSRARRA
jgi:hypothetical protein